MEIDLILEEKYCKKNTIRFFYSDGGKIVFILLTKVVTGYIMVIPTNIKNMGLEKTFIRAFCGYGSSFYYYTNDILYILICINSSRGLELIEAVANMLESLENKARAPASLSEFLTKNDINLNRVKPASLVETQS